MRDGTAALERRCGEAGGSDLAADKILIVLY
jgi:hypothetical protein